MEQHANPIEYLIEFAWANGAARFIVNNAKDELKKLRDKNQDETQFDNELAYPIAWARINSRGDLYGLSNNSLSSPDDPDSNVVALYAKKQNVQQAMSSNSANE
jgi:hypothetical protein